MTLVDYGQFSASMYRLAQAMSKRIDADLINAYFDDCKGYSITIVEQALSHVRQTERFWPRPVVILDACIEQAMSSHLPSLDRSALLTQIDALKADLAEMTKQRDLDVDRAREAEAEVERLRTEHQDAWTRLNTLNAQIADLSHPNMQMLLRDCERLRAERGLELAEVARLQALVPVPPNDPRTCDHSWYIFDGSAHCYMCNETRHQVPPDWTGV